jgi:hypothetical protein
MAIFGLLDFKAEGGLFVGIYGYTPLFAIPFILSLKFLWSQRPWLLSLILLGACYAAQLIYLFAYQRPWLILMDGSLSALFVCAFFATGSQRLKLKASEYLLIAICGACAMVPSLVLDPLTAIPAIVFVWFWQCSVGTILVIAANQVPATKEFNMGVLQT